jgi:parallel beta-helix repeat protein
MKKEIKRRFIISLITLVLILIILAVIAIVKNNAITGKAVLESYTGTGYANPGGVFSISPDSFALTSQNQNITLEVTVNQNGLNPYVFKRGYFWNWRLGEWIAFQFEQPTVSGSSWISTSSSPATATITIDAENNLQNLPDYNFILAYSCEKLTGLWGNWKCGCESPTDNVCNKWMLLIFNVTGAKWNITSDQSCVIDSQCQTGYECKNYKCVYSPVSNQTNQSNTIYIDSCRQLNEAGKTYILNKSLSGISGTCFTITADNIVLDGNGKSITGPALGTLNYGIYASNRKNIKVSNMNIYNFSSGIVFFSVSNSIVDNTFFSYNNMSYPNSGIFLNLSSSNIITNNIINSNNYAGIYLLSSPNNYLSGNKANLTYHGIRLYQNSYNNTIINNSLISDAFGILLLDNCYSNTIKQNLISYSSRVGLNIVDLQSCYNNVSANIFFSNAVNITDTTGCNYYS